MTKNSSLLLKGFEIETYAGTPEGDIIGLSDRVVPYLEGYNQEPDSRIIECITEPLSEYKQVGSAVLASYRKLRKYLKTLGNYTLIPGSALHLGGSDRFYRANPNHAFHDYVSKVYGSSLLTSSIHINIGLDDPELILRACRLIRVEAPLYLALSASSPFLDNKVTGYHSIRWSIFPQTPSDIPLFESHAHYIQWIEEQLALETMKNVRHMWNSVRPNGNNRPYDINRIELRICDFMYDPSRIFALTAFLEARLWQIIENPNLDPLKMSQLPSNNLGEDLLKLTAGNEVAVSFYSLDAELKHWQDGRIIKVRDWISEMYEEALVTAKAKGFEFFLKPIKTILEGGNTAQNWLNLHEKGWSIREIIQQAIKEMEDNERKFRFEIESAEV